MSKTVLITGVSAGIGQAAAALFAQNGWRVYGISRKPCELPGVIHIPCDLADPTQVEAAFARIHGEAGALDVLVNNAGFGISGSVEHADPAQMRALFEVNYFALVSCIQHALPPMRARGAGRIINVSSAAAGFPLPYQAFYSSCKAAVNNLTLALDNELRPFGIRPCALMPGDVRTGFTAAREKHTGGPYEPAQSRAVAQMERDEQGGMPPEYVAARIYRAATARRMPLLATIGAKYKLFMFLTRVLPTKFVNWVVGKLYG